MARRVRDSALRCPRPPVSPSRMLRAATGNAPHIIKPLRASSWGLRARCVEQQPAACASAGVRSDMLRRDSGGSAMGSGFHLGDVEDARLWAGLVVGLCCLLPPPKHMAHVPNNVLVTLGAVEVSCTPPRPPGPTVDLKPDVCDGPDLIDGRLPTGSAFVHLGGWRWRGRRCGSWLKNFRRRRST